MRFCRITHCGCLLVAVAWASGGDTAEIQLRRACRTDKSLVQLGDIADVHASDPETTRKLATIELFPAPPAGSKRYIRAREVQDALLLRGVMLAEHRLSGASQVELTAGAAEAPAAPAPQSAPISATATMQTKRLVREAIAAHLAKQSDKEPGWDVDFELSEDQVRQLSGAKSLRAEGGQAPWAGNQQFTLAATIGAEAVRLPLHVKVSAAPLAVTATRPLPRGVQIHESDVALARRPAGAAGEFVDRLEDVVGKEVVRPLVAGQFVEQDGLRTPLLVRRGDVVTVYARNAGLVVRTTARAKDEGSKGDVITVEALLNRTPYFARVSGLQEVEVYAQGLNAATAAR